MSINTEVTVDSIIKSTLSSLRLLFKRQGVDHFVQHMELVPYTKDSTTCAELTLYTSNYKQLAVYKYNRTLEGFNPGGSFYLNVHQCSVNSALTFFNQLLLVDLGDSMHVLTLDHIRQCINNQKPTWDYTLFNSKGWSKNGKIISPTPTED